jgi:hypothetical protein
MRRFLDFLPANNEAGLPGAAEHWLPEIEVLSGAKKMRTC